MWEVLSCREFFFKQKEKESGDTYMCSKQIIICHVFFLIFQQKKNGKKSIDRVVQAAVGVASEFHPLP